MTTTNPGAQAPEHLTPAELLEALKVCDDLDGCRRCPNLIPGTLGELGDVEIGKCRFELHAETVYALSHQMPRLSDDVLALLIRLTDNHLTGAENPADAALCSKTLIQLETYRKAVEG